MDELHDPEVDPDRIFRVYVLRSWLVGCISFDVEAGIPRTCPVFFHRDVFYLGFVWQVAVKSDWYVDSLAVDFFECENSTSVGATLVVEFETPLSIRETPVLV